jgi:predicted  nucleic acid-binding Zn-ribbon protein
MDQDLHEHLTQSLDESAQIRARQSQEISALREQELPQLHGELERVLHQSQELQGTQEDLKQRMLVLEQVVGKGERLLTEHMHPPEKDNEARLETHEELISSLLIQVNDLSKRLKAMEKQ